MALKIQDTIYGEINIDSPVIEELIASIPFQRLKKVTQQSGLNLAKPGYYETTRYEHSIGVWYVLYKLGADLETQIAGLLHDIGHAAFSHATEIAIQSKSFHENNLHLIKGFDSIQQILDKYVIKLESCDSIPAIKRDVPDIGADRLDYSIRDFGAATLSYDDLGKSVLEDISLKNGQIYFSDVDIARAFAKRGHLSLMVSIYDPLPMVVESSIVALIRQMVDLKLMSLEDLMTDNERVWNLINLHRAKLEEQHFQVFAQDYKIEPVEQGEHNLFHFGGMKRRYLDPAVLSPRFENGVKL